MSQDDSLKINKSDFEEGGGVVVLPVSEYKKLLKSAAPSHQLSGQDAEDLDELVESSLKQFQEGEVKSVSSLSELD